MTPRIGFGLYLIEHLRDLINLLSIGRRPTPPLMSVDWTKVSILICPLIPDRNLVIVQVFDVGVAVQEPQEFNENGSCM
jgi:hypothetical protein